MKVFSYSVHFSNTINIFKHKSVYLYLCSLYTQIAKLTYVLKKPYTCGKHCGAALVSFGVRKIKFQRVKNSQAKAKKNANI